MLNGHALPVLLRFTTDDVIPDASSYVPTVPAAVLQRHDARVLDPATAAVAPKQPPPQGTVYSSNTLLAPRSTLTTRASIDVINAALEATGLTLLPPADTGEPVSTPVPRDDDPSSHLVPHSLAVRDGSPPVIIDAWTALQHLRAAATATTDKAVKAVLEPIQLEHLLFGAALPPITGAPGSTDPSSGRGTALGSYVRSATGGPIPVRLLATAPPPRGEMGVGGLTRRPVVAVLDTGTGPHPWLDEPPDPFLTVDTSVQAAILQHGAARLGTATSMRVINGVTDAPVSSKPLIGTVDTHLGHGTFIAGIIRQIAPRARVLAIRVMHSDGVVYEGDLLVALRKLADRVAIAQANGDQNAMVDVVSLSLGYYDEYGVPSARTGDLTAAINRLTGMGVLVVAAAGNNATSREFLPAALAAAAADPNRTRVISVGASNPNGTNALFSNEAPWVRCWAPGAAVVSTYPVDVRGSLQAEVKPGTSREALDPDDFRSGFAVWDGTSFAAPVAAAMLANGLIEEGALHSQHAMDLVGRDVTLSRARTTLDEVAGYAYK